MNALLEVYNTSEDVRRLQEAATAFRPPRVDYDNVNESTTSLPPLSAASRCSRLRE